LFITVFVEVEESSVFLFKRAKI